MLKKKYKQKSRRNFHDPAVAEQCRNNVGILTQCEIILPHLIFCWKAFTLFYFLQSNKCCCSHVNVNILPLHWLNHRLTALHTLTQEAFKIFVYMDAWECALRSYIKLKNSDAKADSAGSGVHRLAVYIVQ